MTEYFESFLIFYDFVFLQIKFQLHNERSAKKKLPVFALKTQKNYACSAGLARVYKATGKIIL